MIDKDELVDTIADIMSDTQDMDTNFHDFARAVVEKMGLAEKMQSAARWDALMASPRLHFMGCAGFKWEPKDGDKANKHMNNQTPVPKTDDTLHFGMEFWSEFTHEKFEGDRGDSFEREFMLAYADDMIRRGAEKEALAAVKAGEFTELPPLGDSKRPVEG